MESRCNEMMYDMRGVYLVESMGMGSWEIRLTKVKHTRGHDFLLCLCQEEAT